MQLKPITSEKAVKLIDVDNTLVFRTSRIARKAQIKKEIEETLSVKIDKIRTHIRSNKKYAYVKLAKENPAIDVATKLGIM